jgi:hypothetical protein
VSGEKYNWLGFVLDKSAQDGMTNLGHFPTKRTHYRNWKAEFKKKSSDGYDTNDVIAYFKSTTTNSQFLKNMASNYGDHPDIKRKYTNSIAFHEAMSG